MKGSRNERNKQSKQGHVNLPKPEVRDNLDSRKEKEEGYTEKAYSPEKKSKKKD
ncbi:MAG TPA: hypothetical protein VN721_01450 [Flavipsychrobacter sp.]|nr:hypothetical protein [Flavipsychrobacter sp.]